MRPRRSGRWSHPFTDQPRRIQLSDSTPSSLAVDRTLALDRRCRSRMDFSGVGFEAMMLPAFAALHTLRFAFLINAISYLLFPGLIFSVFSALGVKRSIAATWMWIIPCASCFVMEAGSIGNDLPGMRLRSGGIDVRIKSDPERAAGRMSSSRFLSAALDDWNEGSNLPLLLPIAICMLMVFLQTSEIDFSRCGYARSLPRRFRFFRSRSPTPCRRATGREAQTVRSRSTIPWLGWRAMPLILGKREYSACRFSPRRKD